MNTFIYVEYALLGVSRQGSGGGRVNAFALGGVGADGRRSGLGSGRLRSGLVISGERFVQPRSVA